MNDTSYLLEELEALDVDSYELDDIVYDFKEHEGSIINNGGLSSQLQYLYHTMNGDITRLRLMLYEAKILE